jgi:hypothetical protein
MRPTRSSKSYRSTPSWASSVKSDCIGATSPPRSSGSARCSPIRSDGMPAGSSPYNHPSGDPTPSPDDLHLTAEISAAGRLLEIPLLDHLVVGGGQYVSLRERGIEFDRLDRKDGR